MGSVGSVRELASGGYSWWGLFVAIEREPASTLFVTEVDQWAAVVRRDPAADTVFYYSVRTTGV